MQSNVVRRLKVVFFAVWHHRCPAEASRKYDGSIVDYWNFHYGAFSAILVQSVKK